MSDTNNVIAPENVVPVEKPLMDPFWERSVARGDFLTAGLSYRLRLWGFLIYRPRLFANE
jgi:hypothetical protein